MRDFEDKPITWIWYNGVVVGKIENNKEIYDFLKEAHLLIPEQFPVRCHEKFSKTNFLYFYSPIGGIGRFFGGFISDRQYNIFFFERSGRFLKCIKI